MLKKTLYELYYQNLQTFHISVSLECFILNTKYNLSKFDSKSDDIIFLGYSTFSEAYRVFSKCTMAVEEYIHVSFKEANILDPRKDNDEICTLPNALKR